MTEINSQEILAQLIKHQSTSHLVKENPACRYSRIAILPKGVILPTFPK